MILTNEGISVLITYSLVYFTWFAVVMFWPFDPAKNAIQGNAPEGGDTFWWQLWEEIAWAEIGWWNGTRYKRSQNTLIDWRTGREWPLNWMTVISARWRSHRPFQRKRKWHILVARYRKELRRRVHITAWEFEVNIRPTNWTEELSSGQLSSTSQ